MTLQINSKEVSEKDRKTAKFKFQMFDKILQIPEKLFRHSATQRGSKQTSKDVNEVTSRALTPRTRLLALQKS
jgi:hypothetical protein